MQIQKAKPGYKLIKSLFGKYEEIPQEWQRCSHQDVCEFINGYAYSATEFREKGYPIIRIQNLTGGDRFVYSDVELPEKQFAYKNDLLFAWSATFGPFIWDGPKAAYHYHQWKVIPNEISDKKFLYYHFARISPTVKTMGQSGLGMFHMTKHGMEIFPISLPKLKEQQKIASILSNVDSLIKSYDKVIESTIKLKTSLLQNLLTKGIGHTKFKKVKDRFRKTFEIPNEWDYVKIGTLLGKKIILKIQDGNHGELHPKNYDFLERGIPFITADCIIKNRIDYRRCNFLSEKFLKSLRIGFSKKDDVILSHKGSIGNTAIVDQQFETIILSPQTTYYRLSKNLIPRFLYYVFQSFDFQKQLKTFARQSTRYYVGITNQQHLFITYIPDKIEQEKITSVLSKLDFRISSIESNKSKFESLKKGLMQKLLTGQIRV